MASPLPSLPEADLTREHRRLGGQVFRYLRDLNPDPDMIEWALHIALTDAKAYRKQLKNKGASSHHESSTTNHQR